MAFPFSSTAAAPDSDEDQPTALGYDSDDDLHEVAGKPVSKPVAKPVPKLSATTTTTNTNTNVTGGSRKTTTNPTTESVDDPSFRKQIRSKRRVDSGEPARGRTLARTATSEAADIATRPVHPLLASSSSTTDKSASAKRRSSNYSVASNIDYLASTAANATNARPALTSWRTHDPRDLGTGMARTSPTKMPFEVGADDDIVGYNSTPNKARDQLLARISQIKVKIHKLEQREALLLALTSQDTDSGSRNAATADPDLSRTYYEWRGDIAAELSRISASLRKAIDPPAAKIMRQNDLKADESLLEKLWTTDIQEYRNMFLLDQWARCSSWISRIVVERQKLQSLLQTLEKQLEFGGFNSPSESTAMFTNDDRLLSSASLPARSSPVVEVPQQQQQQQQKQISYTPIKDRLLVTSQTWYPSFVSIASPAIFITVIILGFVLMRSEGSIQSTLDSCVETFVSVIASFLLVLCIIAAAFVLWRLYWGGWLDFLWAGETPSVLRTPTTFYNNAGATLDRVGSPGSPAAVGPVSTVHEQTTAAPKFPFNSVFQDDAANTNVLRIYQTDSRRDLYDQFYHDSRRRPSYERYMNMERDDRNTKMNKGIDQSFGDYDYEDDNDNDDGLNDNITSPKSSIFSSSESHQNLGPWMGPMLETAPRPPPPQDLQNQRRQSIPVGPLTVYSPITREDLEPVNKALGRAWTWSAPPVPTLHDDKGVPVTDTRSYRPYMLNRLVKKDLKSRSAPEPKTQKTSPKLDGFADNHSFKPYGPPPNRYKGALT